MSAQSNKLLLGIDVGTYSSKGVLVTPDGDIVRSHVVEHDMSIPQPGWAEHDADAVWWSDVVEICQQLIDGSEITGDQVAGAAFSAIGPCMLPLDASGQPLRPAILYGVDTRASDEINWLQEIYGEDTLFEFSGVALSNQAIGPKILWMRRNEPDKWQSVAHVLTASSYIIYRMTGERVMNYHEASQFAPLLDITNLEWSDRFAGQIIDIDKLPRLGWSDEKAGEITEEAAEATGLAPGTPVAIGAVDALSEAISVGVVQPGDMMTMYGSTAFFLLVLEEPLHDKRIWSLAGAFEGQYNLAGGMATTGSLTRWFRDELAGNSNFDTLFEEAADIPPGAEGLLALPYFSGERTPINDPHARGVIAGLTLSHSRAHLYRAVLEGVAFGIRHHVDIFSELGATIDRILAVGGGTKTTTWLQIVSDVINREQIVPEKTIGASYGDAFLAGLVSGVLSKEGIQQWVQEEKIVQPDEANHRFYQPFYEDYRALYSQTKDIVHRLSKNGNAR